MPLATLFGKRNTSMVPETRMRLAKHQAMVARDQAMLQIARAAERVGPMAAQAREAAVSAADEKISEARRWAAPQLDAAAHTVEQQLGPKLSAMLSQAATKLDPSPPVKIRSRNWPMLLLLTGLAAGAAGFAMYRKGSSQWTDTMKGSASDASHWVSDKAKTAADKVSGVAGGVKSKAEEFSHKAEPTTGVTGQGADAEPSGVTRNMT